MIGIFDSGVGGLSLYQAIRRSLPQAQIVYVADQAYTPYGNKSDTSIGERAHRISQYLIDQGARLVVVACNTATVATPIAELRQRYPEVTFVGTEPPVKMLCQLSQTKRVGLLVTEATARSPRLTQLIDTYGVGVSIDIICPREWVALIEAQIPESAMSESIATYLGPLTDRSIDLIGLGCTHYPFVRSHLEKLFPEFGYIDVAEPIAKRVNKLYENLTFGLGVDRFITTEQESALLQKSLNNLLGLIAPVECLSI